MSTIIIILIVALIIWRITKKKDFKMTTQLLDKVMAINAKCTIGRIQHLTLNDVAMTFFGSGEKYSNDEYVCIVGPKCNLFINLPNVVADQITANPQNSCILYAFVYSRSTEKARDVTYFIFENMDAALLSVYQSPEPKILECKIDGNTTTMKLK